MDEPFVVLVTGDRNWLDREFVWRALDTVQMMADGTVQIIEGCASKDGVGADRLAGDHEGGWARARGVPARHFPAEWHRYRKGAGPVRNRQMLSEGKPALVLAFHDNLDASSGTRDMIDAANEAGVPVRLEHHDD